jgi:phage terminase large subunit-like protein
MGDARAFIATTPRTEETLIRILGEPTTAVSQESTLANRLHLSREFIEQVTESYRGTRFYRLEVEGILIDASEGAVFPQFDPAKHVTSDAEFVPEIPV